MTMIHIAIKINSARKSLLGLWGYIGQAAEEEGKCTLHLRLPDGRPVFFWVFVLEGACQSGTVWAALCLIHHHHKEEDNAPGPGHLPRQFPSGAYHAIPKRIPTSR